MTGTWLALAALGAGHGLNPGMGWLFAVALGLQEGRSRAVWRALSPLAVGHALAVGAAVLVAVALGPILPPVVLKWLVGGLLLMLGTLRVVRHRHPRYGGMRVGFRELTTWSFLMATAHGAGLMVLPLLLGGPEAGSGHAGLSGSHELHLAHASLLPVSGDLGRGLWATAMHSASYLLVTGLIAVVVYHKLGLRLLRTLWFNIDLLWGGALVFTGGLTLVL
ncbi:MAG TPA: hypothetical protein VFM14_02040 [Gemmatimonadales bacterium]|nr:hypothetical protein [Gemmatimonadales bacterium]